MLFIPFEFEVASKLIHHLLKKKKKKNDPSINSSVSEQYISMYSFYKHPKEPYHQLIQNWHCFKRKKEKEKWGCFQAG